MPRHIPVPPELSAEKVWAYVTRELTDPDSYKADISSLPTAEDIWTHGTRTLTAPTPAEVAAVIWAYDPRTLTVAMGLVQTEVAKGTKTADGTKQELVSAAGRGKYEGWVDLANMGASDVVVIEESVMLKSGGSWRVYATTTYNGVQAEPAIHVIRKLSEYGWKVTLQQTAKDGGYKKFDYEFLKEAQA